MADRDETTIGGDARAFPATSWACVAGARDPSDPAYRESLERLCRQYWKPAYYFLRFSGRYGVEEAKDLTQEFFVHLLEGALLERADRARARFRTYLKACLRNFAANVAEAGGRIKRGGHVRTFSLDFGEAELAAELPDTRSERPDQLVDREWTRLLVDHSLSCLRLSCERHGRGTDFELFHTYYFSDPDEREGLTYEKLAERFGLTLFDTANRLYRMRKRFQDVLLDQIQDSVCSEEAARREFRELFGNEKYAAC